MSSISFEYLGDKLILCYAPVIGLDDITKRLDTEDGVPIKHSIHLRSTGQNRRKKAIQPQKKIGRTL